VFHSAFATFYAPSDLCGAGGMYRECIRSNMRWKGKPRHDTVFVKISDDEGGVMNGMLIARVLLFFSFHVPILREVFPCALVNWFIPVSDQRDRVMGTWEVKLEMAGVRAMQPTLEVIHLDSIVRGAHLLPAYGRGFLPEDFDFRDALEAFQSYFVNNLIDYHAHELLQKKIF
jgi:hypothetical protein